jgi:hypothetical protein
MGPISCLLILVRIIWNPKKGIIEELEDDGDPQDGSWKNSDIPTATVPKAVEVPNNKVRVKNW